MLKSNFFTKLSNWEYWPIYISQIPTVFFWLFFAARARSLFFFTTVNPVIETGGVLGESKINILNRIPDDYLPCTCFIAKEKLDFDYIIETIAATGIVFPLIAKPNIGERGMLVEICHNENDLKKYLEQISFDLLIQELITSPVELSVLYYRYPNSDKGCITSICVKKPLSVFGDGKSSVFELMKNYPRAKLQLARFQMQYPQLLNQIPVTGEEIILEPIGNHSRGTTFLNGNHHIDEELERIFDQIALQMDGIYYGRFDMKCNSVQAVKEGEKFSILEFNGIASEPAHIYDPSYPVWKAYLDIYNHWKIIYKISKSQKAQGLKSMTLKEAYKSVRFYFRYLRLAKG